MILTIALAITRALETSKQVFLTGSCCVLLKIVPSAIARKGQKLP